MNKIIGALALLGAGTLAYVIYGKGYDDGAVEAFKALANNVSEEEALECIRVFRSEPKK